MRLLTSVVLQIQIKGLSRSIRIGRGRGKLRPADFVDVSERQMTVPLIGAVGFTPGLTGDATKKKKEKKVLVHVGMCERDCRPPMPKMKREAIRLNATGTNDARWEDGFIFLSLCVQPLL